MCEAATAELDTGEYARGMQGCTPTVACLDGWPKITLISAFA